MKDKEGNAIDSEEFFKRWKQGIKDITPAQQNIINLQGNVMVLVGVLIGLWVTFSSKVWWLFIILCGSLFITSTGLLGSIQKQIVLNEFAKDMVTIVDGKEGMGMSSQAIKCIEDTAYAGVVQEQNQKEVKNE